MNTQHTDNFELQDDPERTVGTDVTDTTNLGGADMTNEKRQAAEAYVASCRYEPGTVGYSLYQEQRVRRAAEREVPDVLEREDDLREGAREFSQRVIYYVPWQLAKEWQQRHHTARSASILLQEAMRAELDRTPLPRECPGCGGEAAYETTFPYYSFEGNAMDNIYELYRCPSCGKCHAEAIQIGRADHPIEPKRVEEFELWRHDNNLVWVGEDEDTGEFAEARKGLIAYVEYCRESEKGYIKDPGLKKYIQAHEGKLKWDELMHRWVREEIEGIKPSGKEEVDDQDW